MESRQMGRVPNVAVRKALVAHALRVPRRQSCRRSAQATRFALHRRGRRCGTRGRVRYNRLAASTSKSHTHPGFASGDPGRSLPPQPGLAMRGRVPIAYAMGYYLAPLPGLIVRVSAVLAYLYARTCSIDAQSGSSLTCVSRVGLAPLDCAGVGQAHQACGRGTAPQGPGPGALSVNRRLKS